jgi:hypothetical protein
MIFRVQGASSPGGFLIRFYHAASRFQDFSACLLQFVEGDTNRLFRQRRVGQ